MLNLHDLTVTYGRTKALDRVSLSLSEGIYGLLGPNGSGKTTLMRCVAGVLTPTKGTIERFNHTIGYLPQKFGMYKELTIYEAMTYFASLKGIASADQRTAIMKCLDCVNLADRISAKIKSLSGGMVRRLGIAQSLLGDPSIILVDEPTAGLDPEERIRFKNLIANIRENRTVLISTHIVEDVDAICDNIIVLNKGKVLTQCSANELRDKATGKVFRTNISQQNDLCKPYFIIREEDTDGQHWLRVLSEREQPGLLVNPSMEDGYMLFIHESL